MLNFGDHGHALRQAFIRDYNLQEKIMALREYYHSKGFAFAGEEVLAKRKGWKPYDSKLKGWDRRSQ